jgi:hypothetical protein
MFLLVTGTMSLLQRRASGLEPLAAAVQRTGRSA